MESSKSGLRKEFLAILLAFPEKLRPRDGAGWGSESGVQQISSPPSRTSHFRLSPCCCKSLLVSIAGAGRSTPVAAILSSSPCCCTLHVGASEATASDGNNPLPTSAARVTTYEPISN